MKSDLPPNPNPREELEIKVTALLLGELSGEEATRVRAEIEKDPELAQLHRRLSQTLNLVRESMATPAGERPAQTAPLKLSPERRERLLASFKTIAPEEFSRPRRKIPVFFQIAAAAAVVFVLAVLVLRPSGQTQRATFKEIRSVEMAANRPAPTVGPAPAPAAPSAVAKREMEESVVQKDASIAGAGQIASTTVAADETAKRTAAHAAIATMDTLKSPIAPVSRPVPASQLGGIAQTSNDAQQDRRKIFVTSGNGAANNQQNNLGYGNAQSAWASAANSAKGSLDVPPAPAAPPAIAAAAEEPAGRATFAVNNSARGRWPGTLEDGISAARPNVNATEFLDSFDYHDPTPAPNVPVALAWELAENPYVRHEEFLRMSLQASPPRTMADYDVHIEFNSSRVTGHREIGRDSLYAVDIDSSGKGPLAVVRVVPRANGNSNGQQTWTIPYSGSAVALKKASAPMRLAVTAGEFSEWLAHKPEAASFTPNRLLTYLRGVSAAYPGDNRPKDLEQMIRQARDSSSK